MFLAWPASLRRVAKFTCSSARCSSNISTQSRGLATVAGQLKRTALYDFHIANGAKMVPFAGYSMPLTYGNVGQVASHIHVRTKAGLFDVGHMVQSMFRGAGATGFLQWLTPSSLATLEPFSSTLSVLLNENGGIIDDTMITKHSNDEYYVVTNAGRRERDLSWFTEKLREWNSSDIGKENPVELEVLEDWGLLALQGPASAECLKSLTDFNISKLVFGKSAHMPIGGVNLHVARGGYTGEDGFEISIPTSQVEAVAKLLLTLAPIQLAGLGARDSLRLEAGLCLYGQDLDEDTTPVEAGLSWIIGKERREKGNFIGARHVLKHLKDGPPKRRVGMIVRDAPARNGAIIHAPDGEVIGSVTSGIPSPTLGVNIAMGYVQTGWHKKGTEIFVSIRNKFRNALVTSMPFVKTRYWRGAG